MSSGIIHVSVMNIRSRSCSAASSRISGILLRMEQVFNNADLIRQLWRSEEDGVNGVKSVDGDCMGEWSDLWKWFCKAYFYLCGLLELSVIIKGVDHCECIGLLDAACRMLMHVRLLKSLLQCLIKERGVVKGDVFQLTLLLW